MVADKKPLNEYTSLSFALSQLFISRRIKVRTRFHVKQHRKYLIRSSDRSIERMSNVIALYDIELKLIKVDAVAGLCQRTIAHGP